MDSDLHNAHVNAMYLNVFSGLSRLFLAPKTKEDFRNLLQALFSAAMLQTSSPYDADNMSAHLERLLEELEQELKTKKLVIYFSEEYGEKNLELVLIPNYNILERFKIEAVKDVARLFPLIKWGK